MQTLGPYVESPTQKEHKLQEENLRLSSKNLELCFQLEQATKDLPRLKVYNLFKRASIQSSPIFSLFLMLHVTHLPRQDQVSDLKDMCNVLIKEKAALEAKLGHIRKVNDHFGLLC